MCGRNLNNKKMCGKQIALSGCIRKEWHCGYEQQQHHLVGEHREGDHSHTPPSESQSQQKEPWLAFPAGRHLCFGAGHKPSRWKPQLKEWEATTILNTLSLPQTFLQSNPSFSLQSNFLSFVCWTCLLFLLFGHSAVSDSLHPPGLQHTRLPCPSPSPRACSNSWPSSQWCHPNISSSVIPLSSCLQSFQESGSFLMSQLFTSGGQSIGVSAVASVLPMNIQDWFSLRWTGLISLQSKGLLRIFSNTTVQKHQSFSTQFALWSNSHIYTWPLEKP